MDVAAAAIWKTMGQEERTKNLEYVIGLQPTLHAGRQAFPCEFINEGGHSDWSLSCARSVTSGRPGHDLRARVLIGILSGLLAMAVFACVASSSPSDPTGQSSLDRNGKPTLSGGVPLPEML